MEPPSPPPKRRWKTWKQRERSERAAKLAENANVQELVDLMGSYSASRVVGRNGSGKLSAATITAYSYALGRLGKWLEIADRTLARLEERDLHAFGEWLRADGYDPLTIRANVSTVCTCLRALRWAGARVETPRPPRIFDSREPWQHRIPDAAPTFFAAFAPLYSKALARDANAKERQIVLSLALCYYAALRVCEASALTWADWDRSRGIITVQRGKGGKYGEVGVFPELAALLEVESRDRPATSPILYSEATRRALSPKHLGERIAKWQRRHRLKSGAHLLRHLSAMEIARETDLREAQAHLRHTSIATTERYAKLLKADDVKTRVKSGLSVLKPRERTS